MTNSYFRIRGTKLPSVTVSIIAVTTVVFLLQLAPALGVTNGILFAPIYAFGQFVPDGVPYEPWRMITAAFAHSASGQLFFLHILFNMYTLWMFGQVLETLLGHLKFLVLYLLSALGGSLAVFGWAFIVPNSITTAVVGASGAIFGLVGAFVIIQRSLGSVNRGLLILVAINLVIGFIPGAGISWQSHVGGLVVGALFALIVYYSRRQPKVQTLGIAALALILVGLALSQAPIFVG